MTSPEPLQTGPSSSVLALRRLTLTAFRNYAELTWVPRARLTVLHGPNGAGKTNLLEAISLLTPGRGLRGARSPDFARLGPGADGSWAIAAKFDTPEGPVDVGTGSGPETTADRRVFRLDGAAPRTQGEVASRISAVWLTPQMDRLFAEGATGRRRFLDRLVQALEPGHARELAAYETAMAGRRRLLACGGDPAWLSALEEAAAGHAVAIAAARRNLVRRLDAVIAGGAVAPLPPVRIVLRDPIADRLSASLATEDWLRREWAAARVRDAVAGSAGLGAHRADFSLHDAGGHSAALASTGQQKSMLIGVVLGHAALVASARRTVPLLLLDEPAVHLDGARRADLCDVLLGSPAQVFLTGTDPEPFRPLRRTAEEVLVAGNALQATQASLASTLDDPALRG